MTKNHFVGFVIVSLFLLPLASALQIDLSKKNKPGLKDEKGFTANAVFLSFLSCAKEGGESVSSDKLVKCAKPYFVPTLNQQQLLSYAKLLVFPDHYTDLYYCDESISKLVKQFEDKGYDSFLCTETNLNAPKSKTAVVFFKKVKRKSLILRIKI